MTMSTTDAVSNTALAPPTSRAVPSDVKRPARETRPSVSRNWMNSTGPMNNTIMMMPSVCCAWRTVAALSDYYKVPPERIIAIHDELDLPYGDLRLKLGGGDNGHNGLKSLRRSLGTGEFNRVRLGIGRPPGRMDPAAFVLKDFGAAERKDLPLHVGRAADAVEALVTDGLPRAQNEFNS